MAAIHALGAHLLPVLYWLVRTSLSAAGIALIVLVVQIVFSRWLSPGWRYRLWGLVVLRLMLPALPASPVSAWNLDLLTPARNFFARTTRVQPQLPGETEPPPAARRLVSDGSSQVRVEVTYAAPPLLPGAIVVKPVAGPAVARSRAIASWPVVIAGIWLGGAMVLLARLIRANIKLSRRLRRAQPITDATIIARLDECCRLARVSRPPPLLMTDAVRSPAAAGFWHRRILLPHRLFDTLPADEQRLILLHELIHIRCRDVAANCVLALLEIIHWFNPAIRLVFARLRADREVVRDVMVLRLISRTDAPTMVDRYAHTLLKLTEYLSGGKPCIATAAGAAGIVRRPPSWMPAVFTTQSGLKRRLQMITRFSDASGRFNLAGPVLVLVLASCTLTGANEPAHAPGPTAPAAKAQPVATVREMVDNAHTLVAQGNYDDGLALVDQILIRDPANDYAKGVRPLLADKVPAQKQHKSGAQWTSPYNFAEERLAPDPAPDRAVQAQLDRQLPQVNFDAVGFSDVIDFLRDVSGANIFVNWKSLHTVGVDPNAPVTARLRNIKFSKALNIILDSVSGGKVKLGYTVDNGVISISTADDLSKNVIIRVYDIRDLIITVPDFDPKDDGATTAATPPATTRPARSEGTTRPAASTAPTRQEMVKSIIKLIEDTVATDSWKDNGGSVGALRELQGQLIVTQTPENHRDIVNLLDQLRESRGIQVNVEARFISCDEQVVKKLMAEWREKAAPANGPGPTTRPAGSAKRGGQAAGGIYLDDEQVKQFLHDAESTPGAAIVAAPRITLFNGQRAYVRVGTSRAYTRDYTTMRTAGGDTRYDPVVATAEAGLLMDVEATASADRQDITLTLRPRISALTRMKHAPWPGRPAGSNLVVDEPQIRTSELETTASIPDHRTLLLGGLEDPGIGSDAAAASQPAPEAAGHLRGLFLLVKPTLIIRQEEQKQFPLLKNPAGNGGNGSSRQTPPGN
jgi:beta-lactamase regulating signal transducer with metallopeptidase domain